MVKNHLGSNNIVPKGCLMFRLLNKNCYRKDVFNVQEGISGDRWLRFSGVTSGLQDKNVINDKECS